MPVGDSIILFGGGEAGSAMLRDWIEAGVAPKTITVVEAAPTPELIAWQAEAGFALNTPLTPREGQVLVLAVALDEVDALSDTLQAVALPETLLISHVAGKTLGDLDRLCPNAGGMVRVCGGVAIACYAVTPEDRVAAERLLSARGAFTWVEDEGLIDAARELAG